LLLVAVGPAEFTVCGFSRLIACDLFRCNARHKSRRTSIHHLTEERRQELIVCCLSHFDSRTVFLNQALWIHGHMDTFLKFKINCWKKRKGKKKKKIFLKSN
jgi:hypothetical protein